MSAFIPSGHFLLNISLKNEKSGVSFLIRKPDALQQSFAVTFPVKKLRKRMIFWNCFLYIGNSFGKISIKFLCLLLKKSANTTPEKRSEFCLYSKDKTTDYMY